MEVFGVTERWMGDATCDVIDGRTGWSPFPDSTYVLHSLYTRNLLYQTCSYRRTDSYNECYR